MLGAPSLMTLQNLVRRDPDGYTEEVTSRLRHFQSLLAILEQQPGSSPPDFLPLLGFISHIAACFPAMMADVPEGLGKLIDERHDVLEPAVRRAILQALVLLRNRGLVPALSLLQRCFRLFRCRDKVLRTRLYTYVVSDIKAANQKHRDQPLNRALQNHVIGILQDASSSVGAKYALRAMIELYRRHVWRDEKTVNVIASALFCPHAKLRLAALHFLLGEHDTPKPGEDSDEEEAGMTQAQIEKLRESLGKEGAQPARCSNKKKRKLQRAMRSNKTRTKEQTAASFAAIHLLHDPHSVAEKLFGEVRKTSERFEVRIVMINLLSRLIGAHRLQLPAFYAYLQRYLQPHQRDITLLLAYLVQACHEQVLPDTLQPMLRHLANHFVTDKSRPEMVAIGLNTTREVCVRVPLSMDETLLADLIEYRRDRDKAVVAGARSLLQLFRAKAPALLHKKYRGKGCDLEAELDAYGAVKVATGVDGAELLTAREARLSAQGRLAERDDDKEWADPSSEEEGEAERGAREPGVGEGEEDGEESAVEVDSDLSGDELELGSEEGEGEASDVEEAVGECSDEAGSEESEGEEDDEAGEEIDALEMTGRMRAAAGTPPVRVDVSRILSPADFERIRRLKQMQQQAGARRGMTRGQKRRLAEAGDSDEDEGPVSGLALEGEAVDPMDIAGAQARKAATREQKLASTLAGREDRQQFGRRKKVKSGGTSNIEKKRTKDFRMMSKSRDVQKKVKRREEMARKSRRSQKKMFRGKVRK